MEKNVISKRILNGIDKELFIKNELEQIPEKIIFPENVKQVNINEYNLFIGEIDFKEELKQKYNIYHEDNEKYVLFKTFPYGRFYEMMYILENKENGLQFCVFLRIELEKIFYKKNHLISLYKQKNVQVAVNEFFTWVEHNIDTQIFYAVFANGLYFHDKKITELCLKKAYNYITDEYFKNIVKVEEYCENEVYIKESTSKQEINTLEEYFKIVFLNEAYSKIIDKRQISYKKDIVLGGAKISVTAKEEEGERTSKIYLILNNKEHFFAYANIASKIVKINLEIIADTYKKENSYVLYNPKVYKTTLNELFGKINIEDLT